MGATYGIDKQHNVTLLALLELTANTTVESVPVWYHDGRIIVPASKLHGESSHLLDLSPDGQSALLFEAIPESGRKLAEMTVISGIVRKEDAAHRPRRSQVQVDGQFHFHRERGHTSLVAEA
ncbi:hypothetical protein N7451_006062 [Penicillium sp. IBT 35674x]|nr:hypothetical protein N7451_006062 [Penicillium sp. IBT 35674x]